MYVRKRNNSIAPLDLSKIHNHTEYACEGLEGVNQSELESDTHIQFYDGMPTSEIHRALVITAAAKVSPLEPNWSKVAARLVLLENYKQVTDGPTEYPHLKATIQKGVDLKYYTPALLDSSFDFEKLNSAINPQRDFKFTFIGLRTLMDRYFAKNENGNLIELPQHFFMRVAMGLALAEEPQERTRRAIEFYNVLSSFKYLSSTPTLFNSGTLHPQMSSCFVLTMGDDTDAIFNTLHEAAVNSKFSGGLGVDFTHIRSAGSFIKSTRGKAGGVIPYMKLYNDVLNGWDQSGKRKGAGAAYLQVWHADIFDFLDARKTSTDERRRTDDIFPATWISDIFMERVLEDTEWSLFSPSDVPELVSAYDDEFRERYLLAEKKGLAVRTVKAKDLWTRLISRLFETGVYWPCFKDTVNRRNMQRDSGTVHSSNLCTEITLNNDTKEDGQSVVCNLGSVNLAEHDSYAEISATVRTGVRMLDNVVMIGWLPHYKGRKFNFQERAVGLGLMGYAEYLAKNRIHFESQEHLEEANSLLKFISYHAYDASADLAQERGSYPLFSESRWARGELPIDTACDAAKQLVTGEVGYGVLDKALRAKTSKGMRFSHVMAIAPTATISNIAGTSSCVEPQKDHFNIKDNLSGNFNTVNPMLRHHGGAYAVTARTIDQMWLVKAAAVRQMYIDQSQSTNLWVPSNREIRGRDLSDLYIAAWKFGLKTTYYLHPLSSGESNNVDNDIAEEMVAKAALREAELDEVIRVCRAENGPDCEACQ